jgi:primosomal replication protein N
VDDNRLVIAGTVERRPQTITSPAGIPITRFRLQHGSVQTEAGKERRAACSIEVVASGTAIQQAVQGLEQGNPVRVTGFLTRAERNEECRLALHAQTIETCSA